MDIKHRDKTPSVHPDAYVAPTAVLSGPVDVGANCVIMEHAVLRGMRRYARMLARGHQDDE